MRKGLILFFIIASICNIGFSQYSFTFSGVSGSYTANSSPTTIHSAGTDDAISSAINIGFTFNYGCVNYTQIKVSSNGWITFNTSVTGSNASNNLATSSDRPIIGPLWDDLAVGTGSTVNYQLTGSAPNRVLTVEWSQMEWSYSGSTWAIGFQCKLYETTNVIEFVYNRNGNATANIVSASASIGISGTTSGQYYSLDGVGTSPTASTSTETTNLASKPATGQIYRWTPGPSCSGTPSAGTATPSPASVCSGSTSTITLTGFSSGCGISYQWQSSPDNSVWSNISGATSTSYIATVTAQTYYRCITTCSNGGATNTSSVATVTMNTPTMCYCASSATSTADMDIGNVTFGTINNTTVCGSLTGSQGTATGTAYMYSNWMGSAVPVPNCQQGTTYPISVNIPTCGTAYGHAVYVFIDYNRDGDFSDAGESQLIFPYANPGAHTINANITIPITATVGTTGMRILCVESSSFSNPCGTYTWGETEDYTINITAAPACSGTPTAGTASASPTPICPGLTSTLTLTGYTNASGITFQWQSSPDNSIWTDISGATSTTYTTPALTTSTYYRCVVTCTNSGLSANSSSVQVVVNMAYSCYCTSAATSSLDMDITNITFGTINNTSATVSLTGTQGTATGTAGMFSNWTSSAVPVPGCMQGATIPFSVTIGGTAYSHRVMVYIDFNRDGDLTDAGESFSIFAYANPTLPNTTSSTITIPLTASIGTTLMRVVCVESSTVNPCGTYTWGETEDYYINITAAVPCAGTPTAGTTAASPTPICPGLTSTITLTGYTVATGITFQWQSSPDNSTWTNISGATSTSYTTPALTASTYYRCVVTCTNSGLSANSTSVQVVVNLAYSCYCTSSATSTADMDITNITFGTINNTSATVSLTGTQGTATGTAGMFSNWTASAVPVPSCMQGATIPFSVTIGGTAYSHRVMVYIDFNRDGDLTDAGEAFSIFAYANPALPNTTNSNIVIPMTATIGTTLMRVVCVESSTANPCGTYTWGETEDYYINITAAVPCAGTPTAGTAAASPTPICPDLTSTLSLSGYTVATGITFQWQSAPAAGGPWTNISGATSTSYTTPALTTSTYYRCVVTCTNSGLSANSSSVQVVVAMSYSCYCASAASSTGDEDITNVQFGTINNTSACGSLTGTQGVATGTANLFSNFYNTVPAPSVMQGSTVAMSVTITECSGSAYSHHVAVYIDFNQDGNLTDPGEQFIIFPYASSNTHTITASIPIPITATTGNTLMRIVCKESSTIDPCLVSSYGETEDYRINITAAAACAGIPTAGTASASPNPVCPGSTTTLTVTGYTIATGITFQWQSAPAAGGPWTNISGATATTYTTPALSTTTYYRCVVTCTNSGSSANTASVQVVVGLNAACYCVSSATSTGDMDITGVTFGTINNTSACVNLTGSQGTATGTAGMYSRFAGSAVPIPNCERGVLMPISVTINSCGTSYSHAVYVFVDFNQDGDFTDANEKTTIFTYANPGTHTISSNISIPSTAVLGNTTMRILCVESSSFSDPCGTYTWGETEDYTVNIINGVTNMTYISCTATQNNTTSVGQGSANKEILRLEVVTSGMLNPLAVTEFRIRTDGTTNYATDIQDARIYYTGNSGTFATTSQFGSTYTSPPAPGTNMIFAGSQTLTGGTNYFWITYDIPSGATIGNVVDAVFQRVIVGGVLQTPTTLAPAGSRPITAPLPPNDEPCGAIPLAIAIGSPSFQTGTIPTSTTASPGIPAPGCSSLGPDVWFTAVVPASGRLIIDMDDASGITDMGMAWYTSASNDCNNISTLIECDDDDSQNGSFPMICRTGSLCTVPGDCAQNATLAPGTLVYVRVWEYGGGTAGDFLIGAYEPNDPGAPSTCANAQAIAALPFVSSNTTCCRQNTYTSSVGCGNLYQDGEDYLYTYTPAANEVIDITLSGTATYTGVFVTNECPSSPTASCIASQTSSAGNPMLCGVSLTAGITYYIMVDT